MKIFRINENRKDYNWNCSPSDKNDKINELIEWAQKENIKSNNSLNSYVKNSSEVEQCSFSAIQYHAIKSRIYFICNDLLPKLESMRDKK